MRNADTTCEMNMDFADYSGKRVSWVLNSKVLLKNEKKFLKFNTLTNCKTYTEMIVDRILSPLS